jgi:hypothetical protein
MPLMPKIRCQCPFANCSCEPGGCFVPSREGGVICTACTPPTCGLHAMHDSAGKLGLHKIPSEMLEELARVMDYGDNKYAPGNWKKGANWLDFLGSALRHIFKWRQGEDVDPESGCLHLAHAICNLTFLLWYSKHKRGHDDRLDDPGARPKIEWLPNSVSD